jgi:hypothetical protein
MATLSRQISQNIDDIDITISGGTPSSNQTSALNIGNPGAVLRNIGLRFLNVTIPQGAVINSAIIRFVSLSTKNPTVDNQIQGIDEDNTAQFDVSPDPQDTPYNRTKTTALVQWDGSISQTAEANLDTPDITSIVQEIVDRGGWVSGNAMAFYLSDDGSSSGEYLSVYEYNSDTAKVATLIVDYDSGGSPSVSPSASNSPSPSPSASQSPSSSVSPSNSPSISRSPSPSPPDTETVIEIAKDGVNVLESSSPDGLKFSSRYGTLKYVSKSAIQVEIDGGDGDFAGKATLTHNLGYFPFAEVFVRVSVAGSPVTGNYEYVPFAGSGASVTYNANYNIKENTIELYGEFGGVSASTWTFDFLVFLYKNDLSL